MSDAMESEGFNFGPAAESLHQMLTMEKRFSVIVPAKGRFLQADKHMLFICRWLLQSFFAPLHQRLPQIGCHREPVIFLMAALTLLRPQADPVCDKIHIRPFDAKDFRSSRRQMKRRQEHDPVLPGCLIEDFPEIFLGRDISWLPHFGEFLHRQERIDPLWASLPCCRFPISMPYRDSSGPCLLRSRIFPSSASEDNFCRWLWSDREPEIHAEASYLCKIWQRPPFSLERCLWRTCFRLPSDIHWTRFRSPKMPYLSGIGSVPVLFLLLFPR